MYFAVDTIHGLCKDYQRNACQLLGKHACRQECNEHGNPEVCVTFCMPDELICLCSVIGITDNEARQCLSHVGLMPTSCSCSYSGHTLVHYVGNEKVAVDFHIKNKPFVGIISLGIFEHGATSMVHTSSDIAVYVANVQLLMNTKRHLRS